MKTKARKCKRCGKVTDKPFHTCANKKPDPIKLGEELSVFLRDKTVLWQKDSLSWRDSPEAFALLIVIWERDFWREKALNQ